MLPPIAVVCPNLSSNALGRALVLAELAGREAPVRVVGVRRGAGIWPPARDSSFPIVELPLTREQRYSPHAALWLRRTLGDDLVVVSKPVPHSLGLALAAGVNPRRMVVDIDDWESGFFQSSASERQVGRLAYFQARARSYARRFGANSFVLTRALEEIARRLPHRVVSNRWLQQRFGGALLYHVRDPALFHPDVPPSRAVSLSPARPWVAFVGTPRRHKGLELLVEAIARQQGPGAAGLVMMGAPASHPLLAAARERLGDRFACVPEFPFDELPSKLALADIIAVPSLNVPAAWGQIPAKLFDGLAMAKPLVVSDVNDMPELVDGCGISFPAGDVERLTDAIARLSHDVSLRRALGAAGRRRFLERFTYEEGQKILSRVLHAAAARR